MPDTHISVLGFSQTLATTIAAFSTDDKCGRRQAAPAPKETDSMPTPSPAAPDKRAELRQAALEYHEFPAPGKVQIAATKQLINQHDLALAYSPGVAAPCEE